MDEKMDRRMSRSQLCGLLLLSCLSSAWSAPLSLPELLSPQSQFPLPTPGKTFRCENWQFYTRNIPMSLVADGICDCCDGSDEHIAGGANPFFATRKEAATAATEGGEAAAPESSGGGWLSSLFTDEKASASDESVSPCPNTCAADAAAFLTAFESRVAAYERSVSRKQVMIRGVEEVNTRLMSQLYATNERFEAAVAGYHRAKAAHDAQQTQRSYNALQRASESAGSWQYQTEQLRWLLGQPVADPRNRQVQRPPGYFGAQREWLLLFDRCFEYAWPQRRFGDFGDVHVDWYLMKLCPLQNATQTALEQPPAREGPRWRLDEEETNKEGDQNVAPPSPPTSSSPSHVLGYWTGELVSLAFRTEQKRLASEAEAEAFAAAHPETRPRRSAAPYNPKLDRPGSVLAQTPEPEYLSSLRGGEDCWQVGPRQADLRFRCGETEEILSIAENGKCRYELTFQTSLACDREHLATLQQQRDEYRKWFARPKPKMKPPPTMQQLTHDEL